MADPITPVAKDTGLSKLNSIKLKDKFKGEKGEITEATIRVNNSRNSFFSRGGTQIKLSQFAANPAKYLKLYPTLAKYTNVTEAQLEVIEKTHLKKLTNV